MPFEVENLGRRPYRAVLDAMRERHAQVVNGGPATVWLVEHDPVYTAGRATPAAERTEDVVEIERGGRITWHGPGQLVVYPIVPLPRRDVREWLRRIESFGVAVAATFGLAATPSVDGTGVFVGARKFASIGVAIRRWVNLHGIGINVAVDGDPWRRVRPCGLSPDVMTDLSTLAGAPISMADAVDAARRAVSVFEHHGDPV